MTMICMSLNYTNFILLLFYLLTETIQHSGLKHGPWNQAPISDSISCEPWTSHLTSVRVSLSMKWGY